MILSPQGNEAERHALDAEIGALDETLASEAWEALKDELSAAMLEAGFWSIPTATRRWRGWRSWTA